MKIKKYAVIFIILFLFMLSGCMDSSQENQEIEIEIDFESQIIIYESRLIKVYSSIDNDEFTFKSSDESIIIIDDNGLVLGVNIGEATITVTSKSGKTIHHKITVIPIQYVESIRLELEAHDIYYAGIPYKYNVVFFPEKAINKDIRFSYDNPYVVINENDNTITFIRAGDAYVFVYLEDEWNIQSKVDIDVKYNTNSNVYDLLFVGNSLTKHTYDIPYMVKKMIENDGSIVYIDYSTNYQYLDQHEFNIERLLNRNRYTHVILQEKSDGLITDFNRFEQTVLRYNDLIKSNGAKTVLYQTWTYNYPDYESKQRMHHTVSEGYKDLALGINSLISLVGEAFMQVMMNHPEISLYADLNHPSIYGAYLSALVHFKTITGKNTFHVKFRPDEISVEIDVILKSVVDELVS